MFPRIQVVFGVLKESNKAKILQLTPELPHKFTHCSLLKIGWAGIHKFPLALLSLKYRLKRTSPLKGGGAVVDSPAQNR